MTVKVKAIPQDGGEPIAFSSISAAAKEMQVHSVTMTEWCDECLFKRGYQWMRETPRNKGSHPVRIILPNGEVYGQWGSKKECVEALGIAPSTMQRSLKLGQISFPCRIEEINEAQT